MTRNPIDFQAHSTLSDKQGAKVFITLFMREFLLQLLPLIIGFVLILTGLDKLDLSEDVKFPVFIVCSIAMYAVLILLTNQYILNSLTRKKYKDFRVFLAKDNQILDRMGFYDCLCWKGSFLWRNLILSFAFGVISAGIEYLQLLSEEILNAASKGAMIGLAFATFYWVLKTKKTGRLLVLQPLEKV